ncbi:MAG: adenylosuccinate synthase [FCB group bacterium]|nr:adenylosuccinate synthase [FCB group bacterium]
MPLTVVIGAQWGDEGKGRIVDALAAGSKAVARFQGGPNAGHTVYIGDEKYILHLIPLGILNPDTLCCVGLGVVVDPLILTSEIEHLHQRGIDTAGRIIVDPRCHLITPDHIDSDHLKEVQRGDLKIGTTLKGIGPAFSDRASRIGPRIGFFIDEIARSGETAFNPEYTAACLKLQPYIGDVSLTLYNMLQKGQPLLAEGGQGTMLDLGVGTYPYVTSSNAIAASAPMNLGLGPKNVDKVVAVIKAYTTRVGEGPFPTELFDSTAAHFGKVGDEFGATTGRPRRCGWFDGVIAKFAARVNGVDKWALTKLDVLDELDTIKAAIAYDLDGERIDDLPTDSGALSRVKPVYKEFPGWKLSTRNAKKLEDLPRQARNYLDFIEEYTGVGFEIISVGYERTCMISL